jgi:hypothetical protein
VTVVARVPVAVVQVVGVIRVRNCHMAAVRPVLVVMTLVDHVLPGPALIDVVVVDAVEVAVVCVIGVTFVREADVAAPLAVNVRVVSMRDVLSGVRHASDPPVLLACAVASSCPSRARTERGT